MPRLLFFSAAGTVLMDVRGQKAKTGKYRYCHTESRHVITAMKEALAMHAAGSTTKVEL